MEFIAWTQRQDMTELLATAHCKPSPLAKASESGSNGIGSPAGEGVISSHPRTANNCYASAPCGSVSAGRKRRRDAQSTRFSVEE